MMMNRMPSPRLLGPIPLALLIAAAGGGGTARGVVIGASADSYVHSGSYANFNFGADRYLLSKSQSASAADFHRKDYIRFNLGSTPGRIEAATFALTVSDGTLGDVGSPPHAYSFNVYGILDGSDAPWAEGSGVMGGTSTSGITWNNAPANNAASGSGLTSAAVLLGTFSIVGRGLPGQVVGISGPALVDFLNADTNGVATLIVTRPTTDQWGSVVHMFASRENLIHAGPQLDLAHATVPEPSAMALGALDGLPGRGRPEEREGVPPATRPAKRPCDIRRIPFFE